MPVPPRGTSETALQESAMAEILSLHDAVKQFVNDGDSVALEGFTHLKIGRAHV